MNDAPNPHGAPLPPGITMTEVDPGRLGPAEIQSRFGFHKAAIESQDVTTELHAELRLEFCQFVEWLDQVTPGGREKEIMLERLEEASMWSHKSVATVDPVVDERPQIGTLTQQQGAQE